MTIEQLKTLEASFVESFLDSVAELFDNDKPIHCDTLIADPVTGYAISAGALLQRIRLHEALDRLN